MSRVLSFGVLICIFSNVKLFKIAIERESFFFFKGWVPFLFNKSTNRIVSRGTEIRTYYYSSKWITSSLWMFKGWSFIVWLSISGICPLLTGFRCDNSIWFSSRSLSLLYPWALCLLQEPGGCDRTAVSTRGPPRSFRWDFPHRPSKQR